MAKYQILYWGKIPAQIRVEDALDEVRIELPPRFQQWIDREAMRLGLSGSDEYLDQWQWSEPEERAGSAGEVSSQLAAELESRYPGPGREESEQDTRGSSD